MAAQTANGFTPRARHTRRCLAPDLPPLQATGKIQVCKKLITDLGVSINCVIVIRLKSAKAQYEKKTSQNCRPRTTSKNFEGKQNSHLLSPPPGSTQLSMRLLTPKSAADCIRCRSAVTSSSSSKEVIAR